nr:TPA_asm: hemagglutinin [Diachasmavirus orthomyxi]
MMSGTALIFLLLTTTMIVGQEPKTGCSGLKRLKYDKLKDNLAIERHEVSAVLDVYPRNLNGYLYTRSKWTSYCYDGGAWDKNTGCYESKALLFPDLKELEEWKLRGRCKVGSTCIPDGDCWGAAAQKCLDVMDTEFWVEGKDFGYLGRSYRYFSYHTCVLDWKCKITKTSLKTMLLWDGEIRLVVTDPNGNIVLRDEVERTTYYNEFRFKEDKESTDQNVSRSKIKVECYSGRKNQIICSYQDEVGDHMFNIDPNTKVGFTGHEALYIIDSIKIPGENRINIIEGDFFKGNIKVVHEDSTSNIGDVVQLYNLVVGNSMRMDYNDKIIISKINKIHSFITDIVISLSKKDSTLMSKILDMEDHQSLWETTELFRMCKANIKDDYMTNCVGQSYTKGGAPINKNTNTLCRRFEEFQNITIFGNATLVRMPDMIMELETSYIDEGSWKWVHENTDKISNMIQGLKESEKNLIATSSGYDFWAPIVKIWGTIISIISILNIIILVCMIKNR